MPREVRAVAWLAHIHKKCMSTHLPQAHCQQARQSLTGSHTDPPQRRELKGWAGGS